MNNNKGTGRITDPYILLMQEIRAIKPNLRPVRSLYYQLELVSRLRVNLIKHTYSSQNNYIVIVLTCCHHILLWSNLIFISVIKGKLLNVSYVIYSINL